MPKELIDFAAKQQSIKETELRKFIDAFESLNLQPINSAEMLEVMEYEFHSLIEADIKRQ